MTSPQPHLPSSPGQDRPEAISILDRVRSPADLKTLGRDALKTLCREVRDETIAIVSKTGGHLGASLGVVELTVALHAVFDTPHDRVIWDVGHQSYPHKILTGRRERMPSLRQGGGISGFTKRDESPYDPFGAAHSSTSISAGLGMAVASALQGERRNVVCVIGDGALSAGMAYEALNNAGALKSRMIVILNDNDMSIAPPVGAVSRHLTRLVSSRPYLGARDFAKSLSDFLPSPLRAAARRAEETARAALGGGTLFEEMGFYYIGPVDGHDLDALLPILENLRDMPHHGPILLHAVTQKGKGYAPAETARDKMHGVAKFDVVTGAQVKPRLNAPAFTDVFARSLIRLAESDPSIVAVTAAMPSGTGLDAFGQAFPDRCFDVGIAEQHAVTFAAGMATEGLKPFVAIYSTFLQRGYDQIVHDVALQSLPVRFAIDRAGLVGADGATHAGAFDTAYLACLPNMVLMAAADEAELARMVATAAAYDSGPIAFRYPRGEGYGAEIPRDPEPLEIGRGRVVREGRDVALLSYGARLHACLSAAELLAQEGISVTVADARFAKPLDRDLVLSLAREHAALFTVEEGSAGGFGSLVLEALSETGALESGVAVRCLHLPDRFQDQDKPEAQYAEAGLTAETIAQRVKALLSGKRCA